MKSSCAACRTRLGGELGIEGFMELNENAAPRAASCSPGEALAGTPHEAIDGFWRESGELYRDIAASFGLSESAWDILYSIYLAGDKGISQRDICEQMCVGKQTVNSSIHKLAREGVVSLSREGRTSLVELTEVGASLAARAVAPVIAAEEAALADLGEDGQEQALALLRRYTRALRLRFSEIPGSRVSPTAGKGGC